MAEKEERIIVLGEENYPPNSNRSKTANAGLDPNPRPRRAKIATAKRVKKPFIKRFSDTFVEGGTGSDVFKYILYDVIIPATKSTIADLVEGAIDMVLFGEEGGRRGGRRVLRDKGRSYVSYSDMYDGSTRRNGRPPVRRPHNVEPAVTSMNRHGVENLVLNSRAEAEIVLGEMLELVNEYGVVSLADLYDLVGLTSDFTDNRYGWNDLPNCSVSRVRDGWALILPRPVVID